MVNISAIITASGKSERFGSNKLMYSVNSKPIVHYIMDSVFKAKFSERLIVLRNNELKLYAENLGFNAIWNDNYKKGMSESIILGIENVSHNSDAAMIIPGDIPLMSSEYINNLIDFYTDRGKGISGFLLHGAPASPVIFSRKYFNELLQLRGDHGGKPVIIKHMDDFVGIEAPKNSLMDIDTINDAELLGKMFQNKK